MVNKELYYEELLNNLHDGVYFVDKDLKISLWNRAAEVISGYTAGEVVGRYCTEDILKHSNERGESLEGENCPLYKAMKEERSFETDLFIRRKDGRKIPISVRVNPIRNGEGEVIGGVQLFTDLSTKSSSILRIRELEKMAMLDNLTKLANRNFIEKEFNSRIQELKRYNLSFGLLFMDIDHFKKLNDTYGHEAGDAALKTVANVFINRSRPYDFFGRWGGEEFIGIIRNVDDATLEMIAERYRKLIEELVIHFDDKEIRVTVSMGATMMRVDDNIQSLIKRADKLMYISKKRGRNQLSTDKDLDTQF